MLDLVSIPTLKTNPNPGMISWVFGLSCVLLSLLLLDVVVSVVNVCVGAIADTVAESVTVV